LDVWAAVAVVREDELTGGLEVVGDAVVGSEVWIAGGGARMTTLE